MMVIVNKLSLSQSKGYINLKNILFVCVENANRSQMAEAFGHIHKKKGIEVYSAGSKPTGKINPKAIAAMADLSYDLTSHQSNSLKKVEHLRFDAVISMGCGEDCPQIKTERREDWQIPDPKNLSDKAYHTIRDYIELKVMELFDHLLR